MTLTDYNIWALELLGTVFVTGCLLAVLFLIVASVLGILVAVLNTSSSNSDGTGPVHPE